MSSNGDSKFKVFLVDGKLVFEGPKGNYETSLKSLDIYSLDFEARVAEKIGVEPKDVLRTMMYFKKPLPETQEAGLLELKKIVEADMPLHEKFKLLKTKNELLQNLLRERLLELPTVSEKISKMGKNAEIEPLPMDWIIQKATAEEIAGKIMEIVLQLGFRFIKTIRGNLFFYDKGLLIGYETVVPELMKMFNIRKFRLRTALEEALLMEAETISDEEINPGYKLLFNNGILNLETLTIEPLPKEPGPCFTFKIECDLNPQIIARLQDLELDFWKEVTPRFIGFLERLFPEDNFNKALEMLGSILIPSVIRRIFLVIGPPNVGKSTLKEILSNVLGKICSNLGLEEVAESRFNWGLLGKLVNISTEGAGIIISERGLLALNRLTGDETITFEQKYRPRIEAKNYLKLIFLLNEPPIFKKLDDAIIDRLYLIDTTEEPITNPKPMKQVLKEYLEEKNEIIHFLLWCMVKLLGPEGTLNYKHDIPLEDKRTLLIEMSNPIYEFIEECCDRIGREERKVLYSAFTKWARENGKRSMSRNAFYNYMRSLGFIEVKKGGEWYFKGVSLKREVKEEMIKEEEAQRRLEEGFFS